jgi:hypothetical protein
MAVKRLALIVAMLFIPALARADNIVAVSLNPQDYGMQVGRTGQNLGDEIVAVTFTWDTTTEVISNIVIATTGPFQGVPVPGAINLLANNAYNAHLWPYSDGQIGSLYLTLTYPGSPTSYISYALDYSLHGLPGVTQALPSTPGTYYADENLDCVGICFAGDENSTFATATVSPVSTPEPNTLILLGAGITALALAISLQMRAA